jgi:hypothetical protein
MPMLIEFNAVDKDFVDVEAIVVVVEFLVTATLNYSPLPLAYI